MPPAWLRRDLVVPSIVALGLLHLVGFLLVAGILGSLFFTSNWFGPPTPLEILTLVLAPAAVGLGAPALVAFLLLRFDPRARGHTIREVIGPVSASALLAAIAVTALALLLGGLGPLATMELFAVPVAVVIAATLRAPPRTVPASGALRERAPIRPGRSMFVLGATFMAAYLMRFLWRDVVPGMAPAGGLDFARFAFAPLAFAAVDPLLLGGAASLASGETLRGPRAPYWGIVFVGFGLSGLLVALSVLFAPFFTGLAENGGLAPRLLFPLTYSLALTSWALHRKPAT